MGLLAKRLALEPGDRLVQVAVHPYGSVVCQGTTHPGPSAAVTAAVGYQRNGWLFWHVVKDGTPTSLAVLRSRLRGRSQLRRR